MAAIAISVGIAVGSAALSSALAPKPKLAPVDRGRLDDLRVTIAEEGAFKPLVYGRRARLAGLIRWSTPTQEYVTSTPGRSGGKGGGSRQATPPTNNYTYKKSFAILVTGNRIRRFRRIWEDAEVIFNGDGSDSYESFYEAENAQVIGTAQIGSGTDYSGGRAVVVPFGGLVRFDALRAVQAGAHTLTIFYKESSGASVNVVTNGSSQSVALPATGDAVGSHEVTVSLNLGTSNRIDVVYASLLGSTIIDRIQVRTPDEDEPDPEIIVTGVLDEGSPYPEDPDNPGPFYNADPTYGGDGTATGTLAGGGQSPFEFYTGTEDQPQSPTVVAVEGADNTPAWKGDSMFVAKEYLVKEGRLGNFSFEVEPDIQNLAEIMEDLYLQDGRLTDAQIDFSALAGTVSEGFVVHTREQLSAWIDYLQRWHNFDVVPVDGKIVAVPRGGEPAFTLTEDDLVAYHEGEERPRGAYSQSHEDPLDVPGSVDVLYMDPSTQKDFHTGAQHDRVKVGDSFDAETLTFPIVGDPDTAHAVGRRYLDQKFHESKPLRFTTGPAWRHLVPGDVGLLVLKGVTRRVRLVAAGAELQGLVQFRAVPERAGLYTQTGTGQLAQGRETPKVEFPANTLLVAAEVPPLRREELNEFYVYHGGAKRGRGAWPGYLLWKKDRTGEYERRRAFDTQATIGVVETVGNSTEFDDFDTTSQLRVKLLFGSLESRDEADLLAESVNVALYGRGDRFEVIQFADAVAEEPEAPYVAQYLVTTLRRGLKNTQYASNVHEPDDYFMLLNDAVHVEHVDPEEINDTVPLYFKAQTFGQALDDALEVEVPYPGRSQRPAEPTDYTVEIRGPVVRHRLTPTPGITYDFASDDDGTDILATDQADGVFDELGLPSGTASVTRYARARRFGLVSAWVSASDTALVPPDPQALTAEVNQQGAYIRWKATPPADDSLVTSYLWKSSDGLTEYARTPGPEWYQPITPGMTSSAVRVYARSYQADVSAGYASHTINLNLTELPPAGTLAAPTVQSQLTYMGHRSFRVLCFFTFPAATMPMRARVYVTRPGESEREDQTLTQIPGSPTGFFVYAPIPGSYTVRVVTEHGVTGLSNTGLTHASQTVSCASTSAPAEVTGLSCAVLPGGTGELEWTMTPPTDADFRRISVWDGASLRGYVVDHKYRERATADAVTRTFRTEDTDGNISTGVSSTKDLDPTFTGGAFQWLGTSSVNATEIKLSQSVSLRAAALAGGVAQDVVNALSYWRIEGTHAVHGAIDVRVPVTYTRNNSGVVTGVRLNWTVKAGDPHYTTSGYTVTLYNVFNAAPKSLTYLVTAGSETAMATPTLTKDSTLSTADRLVVHVSTTRPQENVSQTYVQYRASGGSWPAITAGTAGNMILPGAPGTVQVPLPTKGAAVEVRVGHTNVISPASASDITWSSALTHTARSWYADDVAMRRSDLRIANSPAIVSGSPQPLNWNSQAWNDLGHSTSTNSNRVPVLDDVWHRIEGHVKFDSPTSGTRTVFLYYYNGTTDELLWSWPVNEDGTGSTGHPIHFAWEHKATAAGHYYHLKVGQSTGVDQTIGSAFLIVKEIAGPRPTPTDPPDAASGLTATAAGPQINLAWSDNSSNETGFKVHRSTSSGFTPGGGNLIHTTAAGATSWPDTTATPGVTYYYKVVATNSGGDAAASNEASAAVSSIHNTIEFLYKLDETSGTRNDSVGSRHLTDNNTVGSTTGKVGGAALLDRASSEYLSRASDAVMQRGQRDWTIKFGVKLTSKGAGQVFAAKMGAAPASFEFNAGWTSGSDRFYLEVWNTAGGSAFVLANTFGAPSTGVWYRVTVRYTAASNQLGISVDNGAYDTATLTGTANASTADFTLGRQGASGFENYADAAMDAVTGWGRLLTTGEDAEDYNSGNWTEHGY